MKLTWREVFKFASGAAFAGAFMNIYLWLADVSVPWLGYTLTPRFLGLKAVAQFVLFIVLLYVGWVRE